MERIDEKVVEMRFDNRNFEKNVKTTMSSLDRLKQKLKLDGATKGIQDVSRAANNISLDHIASGVEQLQKRFSTFGIVGMRVVENVTDSVISLFKKTNSYITSTIKSGGISRAMNLENANFQLMGLLKNEKDVAAVMEDVSYGVDGTAYGLDAAAKVASQLAASGMRAGDSMKSALRGISGVAASKNLKNCCIIFIGNIFIPTCSCHTLTNQCRCIWHCPDKPHSSSKLFL